MNISPLNKADSDPKYTLNHNGTSPTRLNVSQLSDINVNVQGVSGSAQTGWSFVIDLRAWSGWME